MPQNKTVIEDFFMLAIVLLWQWLGGSRGELVRESCEKLEWFVELEPVTRRALLSDSLLILCLIEQQGIMNLFSDVEEV